jgi:hypothetical protein
MALTIRRSSTRDAVRQRKKPLDPAHLRFTKQKQISHGEASSPRLSISQSNPVQ